MYNVFIFYQTGTICNKRCIVVSLFWHICQICEHCLPHNFFMLCQKKREKENRNEKKKSKYSYCFYTCSSALKAAELKLVSQRSNYTLTRSFGICTFCWMPHNSHSDVFSCELKLYLCLHNCHKISRANLESLCFTSLLEYDLIHLQTS